MIIDQIKNASLYANANPKFAKAFEFLLNDNLKVLKDGRYTIDGDEVYANISQYSTKPQSEGKWEAHKKYIDIQYVIKGQEKMGCASLMQMQPTTDYNEVTDLQFFEGDGSFYTVPEGTFVIFTPKDAHMPCICIDSEELVKKVVVKIKV